MPSFSYPAPLVTPAKAQHTATVIMLHGLGDTGAGWQDVGKQFASALPHVKFMFPTAPQRPITLNFGMRMTGWYDIASLEDINQKEDTEGLLESKRYIEELVQAEVSAGIPSERVVVAGFSQGGAVALLMLRSSVKLGAVVGLSTYLPLRNQQPVVSDANKTTPLLMCHGGQDNIVNFSFGKQTAQQLTDLNMNVTFKVYPHMQHSACPEELMVIAGFLKTVLP